jgi:hypothetical protein
VLFNSTLTGAGIPYQAEATTLELLAERGIYPATEHPRSIKDRYKFLCPLPGHANDTHPSFSTHSDGIQWHCFPCGEGGGPAKLIELLGNGSTAPRPKSVKKPAKEAKELLQGTTLTQLAEAKDLPIEHLKQLGWYDTNWYGTPAVGIPYSNSALRYRVGLTGKQRFRWHKGSAPDLYGKDRIQGTDKTILLVEGETDTAAGLLLGIPTVGIPGVGTWEPSWRKGISDKDVVLWKEPGTAAQKLADVVAQDIPHLRIIEALPGIKDICELLGQAGDGAEDMLRELIAEAQPYYPEEEEDQEGVTIIVKRNKPFNYNRDKSLLWQAAQEYFPLPFGIKPWTYGAGLYNERDQKALAGDFISSSWLNPANAQHKRQRLFFNILPRINGPQLYVLRAPVDDWSPSFHETIKQRIHRAMQKADGDDLGWLWINNALDRGYYLYLTNAPDTLGFEQLDEGVEALLVDALIAIHPPKWEKGSGKFHPYGGSSNWTTKAESTGEENKGVWKLLAVKKQPTDYVALEAECIVEGVWHEATRPYWRGQIGDGLEMSLSIEEATQLFSGASYDLTRKGRGSAGQNEDETLRTYEIPFN